MTNFATRWRKPAPSKAPLRNYLNAVGFPLVTCGFHGPRQWLLTFKDGSTRITHIRPTPEMVAIHNKHLAHIAPKPPQEVEMLAAD